MLKNTQMKILMHRRFLFDDILELALWAIKVYIADQVNGGSIIARDLIRDIDPIMDKLLKDGKVK